MSELKYRLYGYMHHTAKKILGRSNMSVGNIFSSSSIKMGANTADASKLWNSFIQSAEIPSGLEHAGTLYAGYIGESQEWCLPSWIWTNAATVRAYCANSSIEKAKALAEERMEQYKDDQRALDIAEYKLKRAINRINTANIKL